MTSRSRIEQEVNSIHRRLDYIDTEQLNLKQRLSQLEKQLRLQYNSENTSVDNASESSVSANNASAGVGAGSVNNVNTVPVSNTKNKDIEKIVGKTVMAVLASLLILISVGMFAFVVMPYLTNTLKAVLIYTFGFVLLLVGHRLYNKKQLKFYLILSNCGLGVVYIAIILSVFYFELFGKLAILFLIPAWIIGTALLSKKSSGIFNTVGHLGIIVTSIIMVASYLSIQEYLTLLIVLSISVIGYEYINKQYKAQNIISNVITLIILSLILIKPEASITGQEAVTIMYALTITVLAVINVAYTHISKFKYLSLVFIPMLFTIHFTTLAITNIVNTIQNRTVDYDYTYTYSVIAIITFIILAEHRYKENRRSLDLIILQIVHLLTLTFISQAVDAQHEEILIFVYAIIIPLALGIYFKSNRYSAYAMISSIPVIFNVYNVWFNTAVWVTLIIYALYIYLLDKKLNKDLNLLLLSITSRITFVFIPESLIQKAVDNGIINIKKYEEAGSYILTRYSDRTIIAFLICIIFEVTIELFVRYIHNKNIESNEFYKTNIVNNMIFNVISIISISIYIQNSELTVFTKFLTIILALILYMNNVTRYIKSDKKWKNYLGLLKITLYLIVVLASFDQASMPLSIVLFTSAILFIMLGFKINKKTVRVYGLILSIVSIFKLVLIDVNYGSIISRAIGFLICGIIAFGISFIYNRLEKSTSIQINKNIEESKLTSDENIKADDFKPSTENMEAINNEGTEI